MLQVYDLPNTLEYAPGQLEAAGPSAEHPLAPGGDVDILDFLIGGFLSIVVIGFQIVISPNVFHWMLLPIFVCGVLIGADVSVWLRQKISLFDPKGLIGFAGFLHFVVAPPLILYYEAEGPEHYMVENWRPLLGTMAVLNMVGLLLYRFFEAKAYQRPTRSEYFFRALNFQKTVLRLPYILVFLVFAYFFFSIRAGGLRGLILQERQGEMGGGLTGFGPIMVLRYSLPIVLFIVITIFHGQREQQRQSYFLYLFLFAGFALFHFLTVGIRGSRSATLYGVFWAGCLIHLYWKRIKMKWVLLSVIPLVLFVYLYAFYKEVGIRFLDIFRGAASVKSLEYETGRTFGTLLISDMSRARVQAAMLDVLTKKPWEYRYRLGSTYLTSVVPYIPRKLWPSKPMDSGKIIAGTELFYGPGSHSPAVYITFSGGARATAIYGLAGEAMLNFGVAAVPIVFAIYGFVVGKIRRRMHSYLSGDIRLLTSPFLAILCVILFTHDMTNVVAVSLFYWFVPALMIYLISDKRPKVSDEFYG